MKFLKKYNEEIDWNWLDEEEFEEDLNNLIIIKNINDVFGDNSYMILQKYISDNELIILYNTDVKLNFVDKFRYLNEHEIENIDNESIWVNFDKYNKYHNVFKSYEKILLGWHNWYRIPYTELKKHFNIKFN